LPGSPEGESQEFLRDSMILYRKYPLLGARNSLRFKGLGIVFAPPVARMEVRRVSQTRYMTCSTLSKKPAFPGSSLPKQKFYQNITDMCGNSSLRIRFSQPLRGNRVPLLVPTTVLVQARSPLPTIPDRDNSNTRVPFEFLSFEFLYWHAKP